MSSPSPPRLAGSPPPGSGDARPTWLGRAIALFFLGLALFLITGWVLLRLRGLGTLLLVALVLSFALEPAVDKLEQQGVRRGIGTGITFALVTVATVAFIFVMGRLVTTQVADLIERGPGYLEDAQAWVHETFDTEIDIDQLLAEFNEGGRLGDLASNIAPGIFAFGTRVVSVLFQAFTVALFTFYLVADGPRLRRSICSVFPQERQVEILRVWELAIAKTGGYIFSRAVLALFSLLFHWLVFKLVGVPSPLALALWVGVVSQFIPVVGTYLAGALPALIALADRPVSALWVISAIVVYQQVENYLLAPPITAQTMDIHPAVAFGSVIAGAAVLGPIGALLALPVAATATALASTYFQRHEVVESSLTGHAANRSGSHQVHEHHGGVHPPADDGAAGTGDAQPDDRP
ncbi:MAG: AI-2E family transporter [Acidimicrobiia bacterium]|nr:AI-2E family transporter [Acidimicrobiia bacterium]